MIGSSFSSTCQKMERELTTEERPTSSINLDGNCFECHRTAAPQWDLVCETDHGCAPLSVTPAMIRALQRTDPRCNNPISPEDAEALNQLKEVLKPRG